MHQYVLSTLIVERVRNSIVIVHRTNTILGFLNRASTHLRIQTRDIRLENESRVGTPILRNLSRTNRDGGTKRQQI